MERRDLYGLNLNGMSNEALAEYIERLEADRDRTDTPTPPKTVAPKSTPDNLDTLKTNLDKTRQELAPIDKRLTAEFTNKSKNMTEEQKSVLFKEYQAKYEKETASIKKQQADIESSINNYKKSELPDNTTASEVGRLIKESHSKNTFDPKNTGYFINLSKDNIKNITPLKGIDDYGDTMFVDTDAGISTVSIQDWSESGQGFRVSNGNGNEIARFNTDAEARDFARKALTVENEAARQGKRVILSGSRVENRTKSTPVSAPIEKTPQSGKAPKTEGVAPTGKTEPKLVTRFTKGKDLGNGKYQMAKAELLDENGKVLESHSFSREPNLDNPLDKQSVEEMRKELAREYINRKHFNDPKNQMNTGWYKGTDTPTPPKTVAPKSEPIGNVTPVRVDDVPTVRSNLPDDMSNTPAPVGKKKTPKKLTPEQQANKDFANRFVSMPDKDSGTRGRLASAVGLEQDAALPVRDILRDGGVTGKKAERIADLSDRLDEILESKRQIQKDYRKTVIKGGEVDTAPARVRGRQTREEADLIAKLRSEIGSLELKGDKGERAMRALEGVIQAKNANQLFGAPVERGFTADVMGTIMYASKNPIKMARSITQHGNPASSAWGTVKRGWKTPPKTVTEGYKYLVTNPYRTAMAPAQIAADMRRGAFRTEMTKWAYKEVKKGDLTNAQAEKVSRMAGDDMEVLVNMGAGVDNGTVSLFRYRKALKQWKEFIKSGTDADYRKFMEVIDRQNTLADAISKGVVDKKYRVVAPLVNGLLPYMRNAVNMTAKGVALDLNPFTMGLIDAIRKDQRGWAANLALGIKNKTVDYTVLAALASTLVYNPSEDVDDQGVPPGVSIHMGGANYFSIRGTPIELPLATIAMTKEIVQDTNDGKEQDWQYYGNMVKNSIPYVDYMDSHGNVLDSIANWGGKEGDSGYAAKNFMVSNTKSLVPFSNNNIEASLSRLDLDGDGSRSMNAKKTYDKDPKQWLANQLSNSGMGFLPFVPDRSSLEDSRDAAGRVRTVNNQGSWMNKTINDTNTKTYNSTITDLVKYARQNKLGNGTQQMFNTYDDGKNNNFRSVQDSITFLDAVDGKPDNAKKLEQNAKLADLTTQVRDGFYGDTGMNLLTLDGKNLYSDVSVPNSDGTKNSRLPLNMQSIKNAIAATDLPEADRNRMYEISQANQDLYSQVESKAMTYAQYKEIKAASEQEYISILSNSANYKKLDSLMSTLDQNGFFDEGGLGSTKSGQTYLWNSLNALLGSKGATPAAQYPKTDKPWTPWTPWGRRSGGSGGSNFKATNKPGASGVEGIKWTPVQARQMANASYKGYTPFDVKVKLNNQVKKNRTQNYADRSF